MFVFVLFLVLIFVFAKPATRRTRMVRGANHPAPSRRMGTRVNSPAVSKAKAKPATRRSVRDRWTYELVAELGRDQVAMDGGSSDSDIDDDCFCWYWDLVHEKCIGRCKLPNYGLRFFTGVANFHFCTTWDETVSEGQETSTVAKGSKVRVFSGDPVSPQCLKGHHL